MDTITVDDQKKIWQESQIKKLFNEADPELFKNSHMQKNAWKIDFFERQLERERQYRALLKICLSFSLMSLVLSILAVTL